MKRARLFMGSLSFLLISFLSVQASAAPYIIDDLRTGTTSYWGANSGTYGDVIGYPYFEIKDMTVTLSGSQLTARINALTNTDGYFYQYNHNIQLPASYAPGDLFIDSGGWTVTGSDAHHSTDTFLMNEGWNYVVSFESKKVYALTNFVQTSAYSGTYRPGQAWRGVYGASIGDATVTLTDTYLEFAFDTSSLNLQDGFGLHWAMKCGNDVVEGGVPVPEPATMLLLGLGLVGIAGIRRKLKK